MADLTDLLNHPHGKLGVHVRKLNADVVMVFGAPTPDDGPCYLKRGFPHRDFNLDDATPIKGIRCLKAQPTKADIFQAISLTGSTMRNMTLDRNIGGVTNEMSHKNPLLAKIAKDSAPGLRRVIGLIVGRFCGSDE
jgi:hypothetical protein